MVHIHVYIGPYFILKEHEKPKTSTVHTCDNDQCENFHVKDWELSNDKYCNKCGDPLKDVPITENEELTYDDFYDYCEKNDKEDTACDFHSNESSDKILPNTDFLERETSTADNDPEDIELREVKPEDEITLMKEKFKDTITEMEKYFGKENLSIGWGVVSYYN